MVPLRCSIVLQSVRGTTLMAGYWDAESKRYFVDRRLLEYQLTGMAGTSIHEGEHGLDRTLVSALYPGASGFPADIVRAAEIIAFTSEGNFHRDAFDYFARQPLPDRYRTWLLDQHRTRAEHCRACVQLLTS